MLILMRCDKILHFGVRDGLEINDSSCKPYVRQMEGNYITLARGRLFPEKGI